MGGYAFSPGTSSEFVEITIPADPSGPDTSTITLYLGRTPFSGIAQIFIDGVAITDGNTTLPGDSGGSMSGLNLYIPFMSTSNDIDLVLIEGDGSSQENITANDFADEMLLIGDEVSWFLRIKSEFKRVHLYSEILHTGAIMFNV